MSQQDPLTALEAYLARNRGDNARAHALLLQSERFGKQLDQVLRKCQQVRRNRRPPSRILKKVAKNNRTIRVNPPLPASSPHAASSSRQSYYDSRPTNSTAASTTSIISNKKPPIRPPEQRLPACMSPDSTSQVSFTEMLRTTHPTPHMTQEIDPLPMKRRRNNSKEQGLTRKLSNSYLLNTRPSNPHTTLQREDSLPRVFHTTNQHGDKQIVRIGAKEK